MNNNEGLRYPSIDELLEKIPSKYQLAITAAKRAKIIEKEGGYSSMEEIGGNECYTAVGKALEEILNDKIQVEFKETAEDVESDEQIAVFDGGADLSVDDDDDDQGFTTETINPEE